jgi:hypothetical protein
MWTFRMLLLRRAEVHIGFNFLELGGQLLGLFSGHAFSLVLLVSACSSGLHLRGETASLPGGEFPGSGETAGSKRTVPITPRRAWARP